uniref:Zinc finger MYND domain containing protein 15 n=1 Tax=Echinococcus granulosus TaxID=6210 RepID=A0A068WGH4_ECHGR|nr:zinc finger MYND domain containing protein 15 [Echinococcus granulosus]
MKLSGDQAILQILKRKLLSIHLIGVETEVDLLPVFKVLNVPAYFTDSCPYSCMWNLEILRSVELWPGVDTSDLHSALAPLAVNPFRSPILIRAEGTLWSRFSNAFIFSAQATPTTEAGLETLPSSVKL